MTGPAIAERPNFPELALSNFGRRQAESGEAPPRPDQTGRNGAHRRRPDLNFKTLLENRI
jgi:hypothetical protein